VRDAALVRRDALDLPFGDWVLCVCLHGLMHEPEQRTLVREARRVAPELVVLEPAAALVGRSEAWEERSLPGGSWHRSYRRYFTSMARRKIWFEVGSCSPAWSLWSPTRRSAPVSIRRQLGNIIEKAGSC
jgi:hypothetical protein